jgi:type I restriction enzyme S subunit
MFSGVKIANAILTPESVNVNPSIITETLSINDLLESIECLTRYIISRKRKNMNKLLEQINSSKKELVKLSDVAVVVPGFAFKSKDFSDDGIALVKITEIQSPYVVLDRCSRVDTTKYDSKKLKKYFLNEGEFVIAMTGATIGKVGKVITNEPLLLNQRVAVVRPKPDFSRKFIESKLTSSSFQSYINSIASGSSAQANISGDDIGDFKFMLPDLPVQKKIASILGAYDEKIENNNKIIKNLEETAQTIFNEWFINFKFPGYEKVKMVDSEMGEIPEGWEISSLGEISNNHDSKRRPLSSMERAKRKGKIPYYGANGVLDYIDESIFSGEYILFAEDGTVKTDKGTPVIYLVDADFWVNNHAHIISGKSVSNYYIYLSLRTINVDPYITGGVQPKITQQNLNSILVIVPDNEIKKRFEVFISSIFRKIRMAEKENVSLKSQRDLLLAKLI